MRISDWSSDVCSSDLGLPARGPGAVPGGQRRPGPAAAVADHQEVCRAAAQAAGGEELIPHRPAARRALCDRKSVVQGKSVSGSVDLGGGQHIKKKHTKFKTITVMHTVTNTKYN